MEHRYPKLTLMLVSGPKNHHPFFLLKTPALGGLSTVLMDLVIPNPAAPFADGGEGYAVSFGFEFGSSESSWCR